MNVFKNTDPNGMQFKDAQPIEFYLRIWIQCKFGLYYV
jgi:hypothetical protein